jgi:uncharacterized membrane protein YcaP (DUF421 family)
METFYMLIGREADTIAWWQMLIRTVLIFAYALALYRILPRRAFGGSAAVDIVLTVIISSNLSRALTGNAPLVETMMATTLMGVLHYLLAVAARHSNRFSWLIKGRALLIIQDGELVEDALRAAQIGDRDVMENLRLKGISEVQAVREGRVERNGEFSVLT